MCDKHSASNYFGAHFQPYKKPRISESVLNSSSRMSASLNSRLKQARPVKSEPCLQYKRGHCSYGANCSFSHDGTGDARTLVLPHFNRGGIVAENQNRTMSRVKFCWFFMNGEQCPYGIRCQFLHLNVKNVKGGSDVPREKVAVTVVRTVVGERHKKEYDELHGKRFENVKSNANYMRQKTVFWKTRLCSRWEKNGSCPYDVRCSYAHGTKELRDVDSFSPLESGKSFIVENLPVYTENAASTEKEIGTVCQQEKSKKCLIKRGKFKKITGIYADWIENMPLVHVTPGNL